MGCNFSEKHYKEILTTIRRKGYVVSKYNEKMSNEYEIILRHDIDINLVSALRMAKIEAEESITSTYFIWVSSPFYNLLSKDNVKIIRKIVSLNHNIGLHYELNGENIENIIDNISRQRKIIQEIGMCEVDTISFHKPNKEQFGTEVQNIAGMTNVYSKYFVSKYKYISDSRRQWREGCLCEMIKKNEKKIHALIHPIWWDSKSNSRDKIIKKINNENILNWNKHIN